MRSVVGSQAVADIVQAYDAHMNLVMSQVEESIHIVDVTDEGQALPPRVSLSCHSQDTLQKGITGPD